MCNGCPDSFVCTLVLRRQEADERAAEMQTLLSLNMQLKAAMKRRDWRRDLHDEIFGSDDSDSSASDKEE